MNKQAWKGLPGHYRYNYQQCIRLDVVEHMFELIGAKGGCHLHLTDYGKAGERSEFHQERYSGGIEMHYRSARNSGRPDTPPDHDYCPLIKCPCWHDGSSLWVSENILNVLGEGNLTDDLMQYCFARAVGFADSNFARSGKEVEDE